jgi:hypothetical protein
MARTPSAKDRKTAGPRKKAARTKTKTPTTPPPAFLRRAAQLINDAASQLDGTALKKMFGPLTPAERRDLRSGAKMAARGIDKLLQFLTKPRKRAGSGRSPRRRI